MQLTLATYPTPGYAERTRVNAKSADLTIAFAYDFLTAGEKLTKTCAGNRYLAVPLTLTVRQAAERIHAALIDHDARSINIAGNGIYTLQRYNTDQYLINDYIYAVLATVHRQRRLTSIRSGGQTGIDWAGLVAGIQLRLPTTGLFPIGFLQRYSDGKDYRHSELQIHSSLLSDVSKLTNTKDYPVDDFDLDNLNIDDAEAAVAEKQKQEAELPATQPNDGCDGGACTI